MWVILSIYAVIIAGAVGLYWYTQRNNKENRPSFFTWLKSGWSPVKPAISNRSAAGNDEIGAARSEGNAPTRWSPCWRTSIRNS
ncbi:hypothetical protein GCM10025857_03710 [Alicyclobacillus contaminans]|nr:hypothetical protein GCM10025857_03710 [Alicyclobacillus contaminans]